MQSKMIFSFINVDKLYKVYHTVELFAKSTKVTKTTHNENEQIILMFSKELIH